MILYVKFLLLLQGINFPEFTIHLFLGIVFCTVSAYILLYIFYNFFLKVKNKDPPHISELKREVAIWERTAQRLNVVSLEERAVRDALISKAAAVRSQISLEENTTMQSAQEIWKKNLTVLESKYCITDYLLLAKSSIVLLVVILLFFLSNIIPKIELDLGRQL
jgi:Na+/H+ antiporter NhaD/arsenite permease-like protein